MCKFHELKLKFILIEYSSAEILSALYQRDVGAGIATINGINLTQHVDSIGVSTNEEIYYCILSFMLFITSFARIKLSILELMFIWDISLIGNFDLVFIFIQLANLKILLFL